MSGGTKRQEMSEDQDESGNREAGLNEGGKAPPSQRRFEPPKETAWAAGPTLKPQDCPHQHLEVPQYPLPPYWFRMQ